MTSTSPWTRRRSIRTEQRQTRDDFAPIAPVAELEIPFPAIAPPDARRALQGNNVAAGFVDHHRFPIGVIALP